MGTNETAATDLVADGDVLLKTCQERIGYLFNDWALLRSALTHASGAQHRLASNERLEFLGDAILGAVVCEMLYHRFPEYLEGELTKIKSVVVSRQTCAKVSEALGLDEFLLLGKGMSVVDGLPPSLLADVFESLIAAVYLDGGLEPKAVIAVLEKVAREQRLVQATPPPMAVLETFTPDTLQFSLNVTLTDVNAVNRVKSDLHVALLEALQAAGIYGTLH